jgi:hypothetical protein
MSELQDKKKQGREEMLEIIAKFIPKKKDSEERCLYYKSLFFFLWQIVDSLS